MCLLAIVAALLAAACNSLLSIKDPSLDDGGGGGIDAAVDASVDSAIDGSLIDASLIDASLIDGTQIDGPPIDGPPIDGPPIDAPACTTGVCCNTTTLQFEPATKVCSTTTDFQCAGTSSCGGTRQQRLNEKHCSGNSAACTGVTTQGPFTDLGGCNTNELCVPHGSSAPTCTTCPFGCDPPANACLPPKLWVFITDSASNAAFGNVPAGARAAADIRCQNMYNANFTSRNCTQTNIHAVLQVDDLDDTIARMKIKFPIPLTAQVFRATSDGTQVTSNWDAFVDPDATLLSPVKASAAQVPFWSGRGVATNFQCSNWTSNTGSAVGSAGDASKVNGWMSLLAPACSNIDQHLLCVCWQ